MYKRNKVNFFFQQKVTAGLVNKEWSVFYICSLYFSFYCAKVYSKLNNLFCSVFILLTAVIKAEGSFINQFLTQTFFRKDIHSFVHFSIHPVGNSFFIYSSFTYQLSVHLFLCYLVCVPFFVLSLVLMLLTWSMY